MAQPIEDNANFVEMIFENQDILEKSQVPSAKKKKEAATLVLIEKWRELSGKELTHSALWKKITNLKVRAKSALTRNVPLSGWQSKLLEMMKVRFC